MKNCAIQYTKVQIKNKNHKQKPIFESKTSFIERVADVIHDYNERLKIAKLAEHVK